MGYFNYEGYSIGGYNIEAAQLLLDRGAAKALNQDDKNELLRKAASMQNSISIVKSLLACGAKITAADDKGNTSLSIAEYADRYIYNDDVISELVTGAVGELDQDRKNYWLQRAAGNKYLINMIPPLLDNGADINIIDIKGNTPLHTAVGSSDIIRLLANRGANINAINKKGETPLQAAFGHYTQYQAAAILVLHGGHLSKPTLIGDSFIKKIQKYLKKEWDEYYKPVEQQYKDILNPLPGDNTYFSLLNNDIRGLLMNFLIDNEKLQAYNNALMRYRV